MDYLLPLYNPLDGLDNLDLCYKEYKKNHKTEIVWDSDSDSEACKLPCKLPCKNNPHGWKCMCGTLNKETQTEMETETTEFLLGKLILETCPQKELVETYVKRNVKHVNTSSELLQSLAMGTRLARQTNSEQSHSDE